MTPAGIAAGLAAEFERAGVALAVVDGRLRAVPSAAVTDEVRAIVAPYLAELAALITARSDRPAPPAPPVLPEPRAGCAACCHRTRFGNCARPVEAGLSARFELVAHPSGGAGCAAFEPALSATPPAGVHEAIDRIARVRAWSDADRAHALDAAARCPDAADWAALADLVEATAGATDAGRHPAHHHHHGHKEPPCCTP